MIPDPRRIEWLMNDLELRLNRRGWDNGPATLALIAHDSDRSRPGLLPFPPRVQPVNLGDGNFYAGLRMLADAHASGDLDSMMKNVFEGEGDILCGVLAGYEAWMNAIPEQERDGRMLADIPGSKEIRQVFAIDCAGRTYSVTRVRGEKRQTVIFEPGDQATFGGRVVQAMADVLIAITKVVVPPGGADIEAIRRAVFSEEVR